MQRKTTKALCIVMAGILAIWGPEEIHAAASAGLSGLGGNAGTATISDNALDDGVDMAEDKTEEGGMPEDSDSLQDEQDPEGEDTPMGENTSMEENTSTEENTPTEESTPEREETGEENPTNEEIPSGEETSEGEDTPEGEEILTDEKTSAESGSDSLAPNADEDDGKKLPGKNGKTLAGSIAFQGKELNAKTGREYYLPLEGKGLRSFTGITFRLIYDPDILTLVDFAAQLPGRQAKAGAAGEELEILALEKGEITFACNKQIPEDREWSGLITMLLFKATGDGETSIEVAAEATETAEHPDAEKTEEKAENQEGEGASEVPEDETENPEGEPAAETPANPAIPGLKPEDTEPAVP